MFPGIGDRYCAAKSCFVDDAPALALPAKSFVRKPTSKDYAMKSRLFFLLCGVLLIAVFGRSLWSHADEPLRLDIAHTNSNVVLTWTNTGVALENSLVLTSAWSELPPLVFFTPRRHPRAMSKTATGLGTE